MAYLVETDAVCLDRLETAAENHSVYSLVVICNTCPSKGFYEELNCKAIN